MTTDATNDPRRDHATQAPTHAWFDAHPDHATEPDDVEAFPPHRPYGHVEAGKELDRTVFPVDDWAIIERRFDRAMFGRAETIFAVGNGYIGMRGNFDEGRDAAEHGTYVNGFHETWPIRHAEEAFGFARVGQTIVNAPDAKTIRLYVDDEPFIPSTAEIEDYERRLDLRAGTMTRSLVWRTPGGKRIRVRSTRLVSFTERHLAVIDYEVEVLDGEAAIVLSSQLINRQDLVDETPANGNGNGTANGNGTGYANGGAAASADAVFDPRNAESLGDRVLLPRERRAEGERLLLAYRTANSGMMLGCGIDHRLTIGGAPAEELDAELLRADSDLGDDLAKRVYRLIGRAGEPIRLVKYITYHTAHTAPSRELVDRCNRTLDRAAAVPFERHAAQQRAWLDEFWRDSDVVLHGLPDLQQAMRWNLFQLAQAAARGDGLGIAAKGVTGSGYGGHYFWDTEIFVLPFLTYTQPAMARNALRFRCTMLDAARRRAVDLNERGALFPWRTINGEESSAYYAASTAQYHIDADIAHAIAQYVAATGDTGFLINDAMDVLVETARMWEDLGFWRHNDASTFHIHGVTGPDEYTTVVNDNLFTNVMAQENLQIAADAVDWLRVRHPEDYAHLVARLDLREDEAEQWRIAAAHMHIPYDEKLRVHPQDASFLDKELWDLENTPDHQRPLLLHFHPLVIYRFQVIKQADVVLALLLRGDRFTAEEKRRDFEYYDVLTTGDSSLSAVVQSVIAAEVGHHELALEYFRNAAFLDLADLHGNTDVGTHVASSGGMWLAAVCGFAGMRDHVGALSFDPRLPVDWAGIDFSLRVRDARVRVELRPETIGFTLVEGEAVTVAVRGEEIEIAPGAQKLVPLGHQGERRTRRPDVRSITRSHRADGTLLTASVPTITGAMPVVDRDVASRDLGTARHSADVQQEHRERS